MLNVVLDRSPLAAYVAPALDSDQLRVVNHRQGAVRVLAGPGTGKTTTLVCAMVDRLSGEQALSAQSVLGLTFGRRAALEWRDQVSVALGGGVLPNVSTIHSFCYSLLRKFAPVESYYIATRLLSGPEQQVRAQQLFIASVLEGRIPWPEDLKAAVGTRGLAEEIRAVMARVRTLVLEPQDLHRLGKKLDRQLWECVALFMEEYLNILGFEEVIDYSELIYRTVQLCEEPEVSDYVHKTFSAIFVDEYQDTDPGQVELLKRLVTSQTELIVVGDIDQSIYGFRGADESALRNFHDDFADVYGSNIDDVVLNNCRRFGQNIRDAATAIVSDMYPPGFTRDALDRHRQPKCQSENPGEIRLHTFDSDGAQAAHIADIIVRENALAGRPWSDFAVIVRSASISIPAIYRACASAGIPVEVATDEVPIHLDPAVAPLLIAMKVVDDASNITSDIAHTLLTGPLCGLDPVDLRRFGKFLRESDRHDDSVPQSSGKLIALAVNNPGAIAHITQEAHKHTVEVVIALGQLIGRAREQMRDGASPHEVLWTLWQGTEWPQRLERQALGFGSASSRAHRDLDAICALFDNANRFTALGRSKDLTVFLDEIESQQIPAESLAENDLRGNAVRLLTAHRSKGLQWPFVIVAGAQEELWPNLSIGSTLLEADRIGTIELLMPRTFREVMVDERRLFYVALTRAMEKLVITSVDTSHKDDGVRRSRFIDQISDAFRPEQLQEESGSAKQSESNQEQESTSVERRPESLIPIEALSGRPKTPLSVDGIVASLRRAIMDDQASPELRQAAAFRLSALSQIDGPAFAAANPLNWWGYREVTENQKTISQPIHLSGSGVNDIENCPAKWFLERQVRAVVQKQQRMLFGNVLHKLAEGLAVGSIEPDIATIDTMVDRLWSGMDYDTNWESQAQRLQAHDASVRLLNWVVEHSEIDNVVESELRCTTRVPHPLDSEATLEVSIVGFADRIEFNSDGVVVFDFKTGAKSLSRLELARNLQLALYQFMLENGTYSRGDETHELPEDLSVSASSLVQLRFFDELNPDLPLVQEVRPGAHDEENKVSLVQRLGNAAHVIIDERYEAIYDANSCVRCDVRFLCPAAPEGRSIL